MCFFSLRESIRTNRFLNSMCFLKNQYSVNQSPSSPRVAIKNREAFEKTTVSDSVCDDITKSKTPSAPNTAGTCRDDIKKAAVAMRKRRMFLTALAWANFLGILVSLFIPENILLPVVLILLTFALLAMAAFAKPNSY